MRPWLLIPAKSLSTGKSRLRSVMNDDNRRQLNEMMLARVLAAGSAFPGSAHTAVISECPSVLHAAAASGVLPMRQSQGAGLNGAVTEGTHILRARGATAMLIAAADLPLVSGEDLLEIAEIGEQTQCLVICTDKHRTGTNAIYLPARTEVRFRFGPGSCAAHVRAGAACAISTRIHFNFRVAFDIDTPGDLHWWSGCLPNERSAKRDFRISPDSRRPELG